MNPRTDTGSGRDTDTGRVRRLLRRRTRRAAPAAPVQVQQPTPTVEELDVLASTWIKAWLGGDAETLTALMRACDPAELAAGLTHSALALNRVAAGQLGISEEELAATSFNVAVANNVNAITGGAA